MILTFEGKRLGFIYCLIIVYHYTHAGNLFLINVNVFPSPEVLVSSADTDKRCVNDGF